VQLSFDIGLGCIYKELTPGAFLPYLTAISSPLSLPCLCLCLSPCLVSWTHNTHARSHTVTIHPQIHPNFVRAYTAPTLHLLLRRPSRLHSYSSLSRSRLSPALFFHAAPYFLSALSAFTRTPSLTRPCRIRIHHRPRSSIHFIPPAAL